MPRLVLRGEGRGRGCCARPGGIGRAGLRAVGRQGCAWEWKLHGGRRGVGRGKVLND